MNSEQLSLHLRALQSVTEAALAHLSLPELLRELLARLRALLAVDTASILLCTPEGDRLEVRASKGLEEEVEGRIHIPMGQGIAGAVAVRREAVIVDDVSRFQTSSPFLQRLSSMMLAPLLAEGDLLGVLHVGTLRPHTFSDPDLYLLQVVADRVALAVKNAMLFDRAQQESRDLARAREDSRENEERFRLLFERSPLPMWVFDLQTLRILDVNEAAIRHYGWTRGEFLTLTLADLRQPDEVPQLHSALTGPVKGLVQRGRFRHRRKDGGIIEVEVTTRELDYQDRPARIALIVDVTRQVEAAAERERLMAELERQRSLLQTVTDNVTSALMTMDASGRGVFWNPAAERITGYSAAEAFGRTLHELVHHTHPDGTPFPIEECPIDQALPHGVDVVGYEDVFVRKDGTFFPVVCAAKPILEDGQPAGTVIEVRDVTEQKQAEEDLRRAKEEAERASRAKTEFLSAMSHELRTPLNAIAGYLDLIDAGIHGPVTQAQRDALAQVKRNQNHLLSLINDVLFFTRVETGRLEFRRESVPVMDVLRAITGAVESQARARDLSFDLHPCEPSPVALADPERVHQILLNLCSNAVKFTDPGGRVELACVPDGDRVVVRVADTGRGVPADRLEAIFDPFVQLERHRNESSRQGVGLGLAISRDIARGMGGDLTVQSEPGVGSTFTLILPQAPALDERE